VSVPKAVIEPADLPPQFQQEDPGQAPRFPSFHLPTVLAEAERQTLERALQQTQGNRSKAAQLLGLSRASFYRKLKVHGMASEDDE
ncbi:MAG: helix-turn-helix domain-containing protein, partial [Candidatus Entotheonellia bacterium]